MGQTTVAEISNNTYSVNNVGFTESLSKLNELNKHLFDHGLSIDNDFMEEEEHEFIKIKQMISDASNKKELVSGFLLEFKLYCHVKESLITRCCGRLIEIILLDVDEYTISLFCYKMIRFCKENNYQNLIVDNPEFMEHILAVLFQKNIHFNVFNIICRFLMVIDSSCFDDSFENTFLKQPFFKFPKLWKETYVLSSQSEEEFDLMAFEHIVNEESVPLAQYLFLLGHILTRHRSSTHKFLMNYKMLKCFKILLSVYNFEVVFSTCYMLTQYCACNQDKDETTEMTELIFLKIVEVIRRCDNGKKGYDKLKAKMNLDINHSPLSILVQLLDYNNSLSRQLNDVDFVSYLNNSIANQYNPNSSRLMVGKSYTLSTYFSILSFMAIQDEETKLHIAKGNAIKLVSKTLKVHYKILNEFSNLSDIRFKHLKAVHISNNLTYSSCLLLRSLSRSASVLNLIFYKSETISLLMNLLDLDLRKLKNMRFSNKSLYNYEVSLVTLVLKILSNLIIEFSAVNNSIDLKKLFKILRNYLDFPEFNEILISSLQLIRNGLFGAYKLFKDNFIEFITLKRIFRLCEYNENMEVKTLSFNIIRNSLTEWSTDGDFSCREFQNYKAEIEGKQGDLIEFLNHYLTESSSIKLTISICYNLINLAASSMNIKLKIMKNKATLINLLNLLNDPNLKIKFTYEKGENLEDLIWELKTCITWILYNLTSRMSTPWTDVLSTSDDHDHLIDESWSSRNESSENDMENLRSVSGRSKLLLDLGFHDSLKNLVEFSPSSDFKERANTVMFQLLVSSGDV